MARAKHRGTGPKPNKNKVTIGDGSIRDLAYWLMGGDVSVKRGKHVVPTSDIKKAVGKEEWAYKGGEGTFTRVPTILSRAKTGNIRDSYYNPLTDYEGKYDTQTIANQRANQRRKQEMMAERERVNRADPFPKNVYGERMGEFDQPRSRMYDSPMYRGTGTAAGDRRTFGSFREPTLRPRPAQLRPASPTSPQLNRNVPLMGREPQRPPRKPLPPMQQIPDEDAWGAMSYMGGPVKRRKRKKYMGGGKMRKYAKGGGIRKAKYS